MTMDSFVGTPGSCLANRRRWLVSRDPQGSANALPCGSRLTLVSARQLRRPLLPEDLAVGICDLDVLEPPGHMHTRQADLAAPAIGMRNPENALTVEDALDPLTSGLDENIVP